MKIPAPKRRHLWIALALAVLVVGTGLLHLASAPPPPAAASVPMLPAAHSARNPSGELTAPLPPAGPKDPAASADTTTSRQPSSPAPPRQGGEPGAVAKTHLSQTAALGKMDAEIARGFQKIAAGGAIEPRAWRLLGIPINDEGTITVDIEVPVSKGLLDQIASVGGSAEGSPDPARIVTATVPFSALKALAARADVHTISVAERIATSGMKIRSEISGNGNADQ